MEARQLPNLDALGILQPATSGLGLSNLNGLTGSVAGLPGAATGLATGLTGGLTQSLSGGLDGTVQGFVNSLGVGGLTNSVNGLLEGLPVAGPLVGQVEGLTGLSGLLGQSGSAPNTHAAAPLSRTGSGPLAQLLPNSDPLAGLQLSSLNGLPLRPEDLEAQLQAILNKAHTATNLPSDVTSQAPLPLPVGDVPALSALNLPSLQNQIAAAQAQLANLQALAAGLNPQGQHLNQLPDVLTSLQGISNPAQSLQGVLGSNAGTVAASAQQLPQQLSRVAGAIQNANPGSWPQSPVSGSSYDLANAQRIATQLQQQAGLQGARIRLATGQNSTNVPGLNGTLPAELGHASSAATQALPVNLTQGALMNATDLAVPTPSANKVKFAGSATVIPEPATKVTLPSVSSASFTELLSTALASLEPSALAAASTASITTAPISSSLLPFASSASSAKAPTSSLPAKRSDEAVNSTDLPLDEPPTDGTTTSQLHPLQATSPTVHRRAEEFDLYPLDSPDAIYHSAPTTPLASSANSSPRLPARFARQRRQEFDEDWTSDWQPDDTVYSKREGLGRRLRRDIDVEAHLGSDGPVRQAGSGRGRSGVANFHKDHYSKARVDESISVKSQQHTHLHQHDHSGNRGTLIDLDALGVHIGGRGLRPKLGRSIAFTSQHQLGTWERRVRKRDDGDEDAPEAEEEPAPEDAAEEEPPVDDVPVDDAPVEDPVPDDPAPEPQPEVAPPPPPPAPPAPAPVAPVPAPVPAPAPPVPKVAPKTAAPPAKKPKAKAGKPKKDKKPKAVKPKKAAPKPKPPQAAKMTKKKAGKGGKLRRWLESIFSEWTALTL